MPNRSDHDCRTDHVLAATATATDATPVLSAAMDVSTYDSAHFTLAIGATLGSGAGAMTYAVYECDTVGGTYTAAPTTSVVDLGGALAANTAKRIAYVGNLEFIKLRVVPKASDVYTVLGSRGRPNTAPTANPAALP